MSSIAVNELTIDFGGLRALDRVTLSISPGERRVVLGPNGAGKTTLFNAMTGLLRPSGGTISLFDVDVTSLSTYRRARLGLGRTFQINTLFPNLSLLDSAILALRGRDGLFLSLLDSLKPRHWHVSEAEQLLDQWGLADKRNMLSRELSYGEQRQLELVIALATKPRVLLLDEPTAGLSAGETAMVASMIEQFPKDLSVLIIEHDMDFAMALADIITVMHQGRVLVEGAKDDVRRDSRVTEIYLGSEDARNQ
jgi:branched-chain amino acid transport system ATP-binding protein